MAITLDGTNGVTTPDLTVDTSTLKVDASNNRVGIGTTSPDRTVSIKHASQSEIGFKTGSVSNGALIYYNDSENKLLLRTQEVGERIEFQTGGTGVRASITDNGICFGTDTAAANALDDYEEGTWTPALTGLTLSTAAGNYTKIGQMVFWGFRVILPTTTANTHFNVTGLPYTHSLSSDFRFGGALIYANHNIGADVTCIVVNNGVQFYKNGSSFVEYGDYNGKDVRASGSYITTS